MELISKAEVFRILAESSDVEVDIDNLPMIFLGDELVCDTVTAWNKGYMAAMSERPKGKWIGGTTDCFQCSNCRELSFYPSYVKVTEVEWKYCPWCGAEMESE